MKPQAEPVCDAGKRDNSVARTAPRKQFIDVVRGIAIVGVVVYHFSWDLNFFGFIATDVTQHPLWVAYARSLAGSFMALVGISLVLAHGDGIRWVSFWKRFVVIATAAIAVSLATYFFFPQGFIYFGILHAIALSSVLGLVFLRTPIAISLAAIAAIWLLSEYVQSDVFNSRTLAWIGFASQPASSNDYVPMFPWLAVTLLGILGARLTLGRPLFQRFGAANSNARIVRSLAWAGRRSLAIYLLHQPLLLGILYPVAMALWSR